MDPTSLKVLLSGSKKDGSLYVDDVFSTFLYEGNNSTNTITNGIDFAGEGGMLWVKARNNSSPENHTIVDTERPIKSGENGYPYLTSAHANPEYESGLTSFNSDGFTWGYGNNQYNGSLDYVSWSFRKAPGFFDVVTFTGDGVAGRTISHSLGSTPGMVIVKSTSHTENWAVWHRSISNTQMLQLHSEDDVYNQSEGPINIWNSTTPTATEFTVGDWSGVNQNGYSYVAYIFAHDDASFGTNGDESIIKCGSYTVPSASNFEVNLGFEPQFVLVKNITDNNTSAASWYLLDSIRGSLNSDNLSTAVLSANKTLDEQNALYAGSGYDLLQPVPTGFRVPGANSPTATGNVNSSYVYMAIRRPNKPPESATEVFNVSYRITGEPTYPAPFVVDGAILATTNGPGGSDNTYHGWFSRLTGKYGLSSTSTNSQYNWGTNSGRFDHMDGWGGSDTASTYSHSYMFKRAPAFFDVVAYTGQSNTANHNVNHNLGVVPELIFFKRRSGTKDWYTYSSVTGTGKALYLNNDLGVVTDSSFISTTPTSTVIPTNSYAQIDNQDDTYTAFLFATLPGISKVGSYSGSSGYDVNVDCGFTAGARFVMIKRTDSAGDWFVYDTLRGITTGNDPYIYMNNANQQVTNYDYIDPLSSGFTVTSSAPTALNTSGATYLFLAIA